MLAFGRKVNSHVNSEGHANNDWVDCDKVVAMAYDIPVPGFKTDTVNSLRLWTAKSTREFNLETFNSGDYIGAVHNKNQSEVISKVLYPNDNNYDGKELRLKQQYFMVSASIQDILCKFEATGNKMEELPAKVAIQLNDTHPSIAIPELMRILIDYKDFDWDVAWSIVT